MKYLILYLICQIITVTPLPANTINIAGNIIEYSCNIKLKENQNECLSTTNINASEKVTSKKIVSESTSNRVVTITYF